MKLVLIYNAKISRIVAVIGWHTNISSNEVSEVTCFEIDLIGDHVSVHFLYARLVKIGRI